MNVQECYSYVEQRLNKLGTNFSEKIEKYQFVEAFNTMQILWVESRFKLDETNIVRMDELQQLLTTKTLKKKKVNNYYECTLPEDYLHYKRSVSYVPCEIKNYLVKEGDINRLLEDEFWKPSLEWGETICTLGGNSIRVYVDNFSIDKVELHYYRTPVKISMVGVTNANGQLTTDVHPEFKNSSLIEILNLTCHLLASDTSDQWNYQTLTNLVQSFT